MYNDSHEKVCILSGIKETCITSTLKTGDKEITFEFRKTNRYAADIKEEGYIRTDTDEFVIKQVEPSGEWYKCTGTLNVEELEGKQYPQGFETVEYHLVTAKSVEEEVAWFAGQVQKTRCHPTGLCLFMMTLPTESHLEVRPNFRGILSLLNGRTRFGRRR